MRPPPRAIRHDTRFPYTALFRSGGQCFAGRSLAGLRSGGAWPFDEAGKTVGGVGCGPGDAAPHTAKGDTILDDLAALAPEAVDHWMIGGGATVHPRSEEHTSELQSLMRISYAVFCLKKNK